MLTKRPFMSKLSSDSNNPMTCCFVYENPMIRTNRGHFGGLRQKLGNDRALIMVGVFENSPPNKKSPALEREKGPASHEGKRGRLVPPTGRALSRVRGALAVGA